MRSTIDATTLALYQGGVFDTHVRVKVQNGSGTYIALINRLQAYDLNLPNPDEPIGSLDLDFIRESSVNNATSLAPTVAASSFNKLDDGTTYSPLLQLGRLITFEVALTAERAARPADGSSTWYEVFKGYITAVDWPQWSSHKAHIKCNGLAGVLQIAKSETEYTYAAGTTIDAVARAILDNNGFSSVLIDFPVVTGKVLPNDYAPGLQKTIWSQLWSLAQSMGWIVYYRYDGHNAAKLTFFEPARTKTVADLTINNWWDFNNLSVSDDEVRNRGYVYYIDSNGDEKHVGPDDASASIAKYGGSLAIKRPFWIVLDENSPIRSSGDAQDMLDAALADVSDPDMIATVETFAMVFGEVGVDLYTFVTKQRFFDSDQKLAPFKINVSSDATTKFQAKSSLNVRGAPTAGVGTWRNLSTAGTPNAFNPSGWLDFATPDADSIPRVILNTDNPLETGSWRLRVALVAEGVSTFPTLVRGGPFDDGAAEEFSGNNFGLPYQLTGFPIPEGMQLNITILFFKTTATSETAQELSVASEPVTVEIRPGGSSASNTITLRTYYWRAVSVPVDPDKPWNPTIVFDAGALVQSVHLAYYDLTDPLTIYEYDFDVTPGVEVTHQIGINGDPLTPVELGSDQSLAVTITPYDDIGGAAGTGNAGVVREFEIPSIDEGGPGGPHYIDLDAVSVASDALVLGSRGLSFGREAITGRVTIGYKFDAVAAGADPNGVINSDAIVNDMIAKANAIGGGEVYISGEILVDSVKMMNNVLLVADGFGGGLKQSANAYDTMDTGTSTGSNTTAKLKDTSKAWAVNAHFLKTLVILSGPLAGQKRMIIANTATELTIGMESGVGDEPWASVPGTVTYAIRRGKPLVTSATDADAYWGMNNIRLNGNKANQGSFNFGIYVAGTYGHPGLYGENWHAIRDVLIQDVSGSSVCIGGIVSQAAVAAGTGPRSGYLDNVISSHPDRHGFLVFPGGGTDWRHNHCESAGSGLAGFVGNMAGGKYSGPCKAFGAGEKMIVNQGSGFLVVIGDLHADLYGQENWENAVHLINSSGNLMRISADGNRDAALRLFNSSDNLIEVSSRPGVGLLYVQAWAVVTSAMLTDPSERNTLNVNAKTGHTSGVVDPSLGGHDNSILVNNRFFGEFWSDWGNGTSAQVLNHFTFGQGGAAAAHPIFTFVSDFAGATKQAFFQGFNGTLTKHFLQFDYTNGKLILGAASEITVVQIPTGVTLLAPSIATDTVIINKAAGTDRILEFQTAGSIRWRIRATSEAESGSNVGSRLWFDAYSDAGAYIDTPIVIPRYSSGAVTFNRIIQAAQGIQITGGNPAAGTMFWNSTYGFSLQLATGSAYDWIVINPGNTAAILTVPTGTQNIQFGGTITLPNTFFYSVTDGSDWDLRPGQFGFGLRLRPNGSAGGAAVRRFQVGMWDNVGAYTMLLQIDESALATFAGGVTIVGGASALTANSIVTDWSGGYARIIGVGPDAATAGAIKLCVSATDASPFVEALVISAAGDATFYRDVQLDRQIILVGNAAPPDIRSNKELYVTWDTLSAGGKNLVFRSGPFGNIMAIYGTTGLVTFAAGISGSVGADFQAAVQITTANEAFRWGKTGMGSAGNPYYVLKHDNASPAVGMMTSWDGTNSYTYLKFDHGNTKLVLGDPALSKIEFGFHAYPAVTNTYDLGNATFRFRIAYMISANFSGGIGVNNVESISTNEAYRWGKNSGMGSAGNPYYVIKHDNGGSIVSSIQSWDGSVTRTFLEMSHAGDFLNLAAGTIKFQGAAISISVGTTADVGKRVLQVT